MKDFNFRGLRIPIWPTCMLLLGIVSGILFILYLSAHFKIEFLENARSFVMAFPFAFTFVYLIFYPRTVFPGLGLYLLGCFFGAVVSFVIGFMGLIIFGICELIKFLAGLNVKELFGILSAVIVLASYPVYMIRIWQRKITPNLASWTIFVLIAIALFLSSFSSSGAGTNSWVTIGPLVGCTGILIFALLRSKEKSMTKFDITCLILAVLSILLWFFTKQSRELVQFALYIGILADFIGILPSMNFLLKHPEKDRPAMWLIFSIGYFLSMFAIKENTFANWILPSFMTIAPALVWIPLVRYRIKNKIPLKEWV